MKKLMDMIAGIYSGLWLLLLAWVLIAAASLTWIMKELYEHSMDEVKVNAKALFSQELIFRRWNAGHGGVYVPITETTQPNPYLSHIPERDVTTTTGKKLTLINPAYMSRQLHELMLEDAGGRRGHITSLKPIRAENKADAWETSVLKTFEAGKSEAFSREKMADGKEYFRFMGRLLVEQSCLKCHATQGYKLGDVRGGISISVPVEAEVALLEHKERALFIGHALLWGLGWVVLFIGGVKHTEAKAERRRVNETFRTLYSSSRDAIMILSTEGLLISGNQASITMYGCRDEAELVTMSLPGLCPEIQPDGRKSVEIEQEKRQQALRDEVNFFECVHRRVDGTVFPTEVMLTRMEVDGKTLLQASVRDISERRLAEESLKDRLTELERFHAATIEREFRIKQLRDEIAALKAASRLGDSHETD